MVFFTRLTFVEKFVSLYALGVEASMARPFYPFVDNDAKPQDDAGDGAPIPAKGPSATEVRYAARIAVYDDAAAAPRVVIVDPKDVRSYLEEITSQVTSLSHEQGGSIPFMVIREIVENFIHAYFIEPTISILDGGDTIRFSDQGPGIKEKDRALEYGTSSATEEMKQYIRGVGSGLPYAQQYMVDKGGSLTIEDNISQGTVVTISTHPAGRSLASPYEQTPTPPMAPTAPSQNPYQQAGGYPPYQGQPWTPTAQAPYAYAAPYPQQQPSYPYQGTNAPYQQGQFQQAQGLYPQQAQQWPQGAGAAQGRPAPQQAPASPPASDPFPWVSVSQRGHAILAYLTTHDSVGPTDLAREYGESQPTWTRELKTLEEEGLIKKDGQKRRLTRMGTAYVTSRQP